MRSRSPASAVIVFGLVAVAMPVSAPAAPPNVIVILADDLGFSDLGCYGGEIDTPNLDRLAANGLRYTHGCNTARCWPTRAALLTGYYAQAVRRDALPGEAGGAKAARPGWARLLPTLLEPAGYRSYHSGKWHVDGEPLAQGFHRSLDVNATGQSNYFDPTGVSGETAADPPADFYATTAIGDHAIACLADHFRAHPARPFFQYVAFTAPHFPLHAPPELIAKYRDRYLAGWDAIRRTRIARVQDLAIVTSPPAAIEREVGPPYSFPDAVAVLGPGEVDRPLPWETLTPEQQEFQAAKMAIHAAMVEEMDREVGRIIRQLEALEALDDTLILFASDNGASAEIMVRGEGHDPAAPPGSRQTFLCLGPGWSSCCNTPFRRHKTWVHEGGIATPWIVHWPQGISARGELRHQPVHVVDVVPTTLELAGVPLPREHDGMPVPPLHGRSFVKSLTNPAAPPGHDALWWCHEGHRAVRVGEMKLVAVKQRPWELYDLATDRCETQDLATARPEQVAALEAAWNRVAAECRGHAAPAATRKPTPVADPEAESAEQYPPPTFADVAYGPHPKQVLHVWKAAGATAARPAPLVFFIHGGGWVKGSRFSRLSQVLPALLDEGISIASVEYRFIREAMAEGIHPPVKAPLADAARALQTVRARAAEWHVDPRRIAACGSSAGACSSLWLAFHDDMADPTSADPVARESTRLLTAAVIGAQTSLDPEQMREWTPNSTYGGHAFGITKGDDGVTDPFAAFLAARSRLLPEIGRYSPYALVSADDPPVYLVYAAPPEVGKPAKDPTHTANFGVKLKERLDEFGVGCEVAYPGSTARHATVKDYLRDALDPRD